MNATDSQESERRSVADSVCTLTLFMLPEHANPFGTVHGGVILKLCDECGGIVAARHARQPAVTVHVDGVSFYQPIRVGQVVSVRGQLAWVGNSSMEVELHVEAEDLLSGVVTHTHTAYFVYVALHQHNRVPVRVPRLALQTEAERTRFIAGEERRARRLAQQ